MKDHIINILLVEVANSFRLRGFPVPSRIEIDADLFSRICEEGDTAISYPVGRGENITIAPEKLPTEFDPFTTLERNT